MSQDLIDRLRGHSYRMQCNKATAMNGHGYSTTPEQMDDLEAALDEAADKLEVQARLLESTPTHRAEP